METSKTKLKDLKYEINGYEGNRPLIDLLGALGIAALIDFIIVTVIVSLLK